MNNLTDQQLLRAYTERRSEAAFAEVVHRHIDLVYSAALRLVRDTHLAEDVAQGVFLALARNARQLTDRPVLSGWLHRTTQNLAANAVRSDVRRRAREQEAAAMNELLSVSTESDGLWENIAHHLDAALGELNESDRDAVLLRYFEKKSASEMAATLGISDEAAQKRVSRAVERLREFLAKRGVTVGTSGLVVVISANAVQAAPVGLPLTISTAAALTGITLATTATATATKAIAMTALQKTIVTAAIAVLAGAGIYEARQATQLRNQVQTLQQKQAALATQLTQLATDNQQLSNRLAQASPPRSLSAEQFAELLKLRGRMQLNAKEIADLKSALAQSGGKIPEPVAKIMHQLLTQLMTDEQQRQRNIALGKLNQMSQKLGFDTEQHQSVRDLLLASVVARTELEVAYLTGTLTAEDVTRRKQLSAEEDRKLAALLTPEQLARFEQMKSDETTSSRSNWVGYETYAMKNALKLSGDQAGQVAKILASLKAGQGGQGITYYVDSKEQLEVRLQALTPALTPDQLQAYRKLKTEEIDQQLQIGQIVRAFK